MKKAVMMLVVMGLLMVYSGGVLAADECGSWNCTYIGEFRCANTVWCYSTLYAPQLLEEQKCVRVCKDVLGNYYDDIKYSWSSQGCCW